MANTYTAIATVTVGSGGASTIEFTSIPATYTDLNVLASTRSTGDQASVNYCQLRLELNGNTSNYSDRLLYGIGGLGAGSLSNNKSISSDGVTESNATNSILTLDAGLWANSSAITSLKFTLEIGNFAQYSTATLYGIKNS
jgi:hypothetical protein